MKCEACGAVLGPSQPSCSFCGTITPFGVQQQHLQHQQAAHAHAFQLHQQQQQEAYKRNEAQRSLKRTADAALYWGIGGWVACCSFIPSVVAIVLGLRARKMARLYDLVIPTSSTLGLVFGTLGILSGAGLITLGVVTDMQRDEELESIDAALEGKLEQATISQPTACLLAKKSLLKGEFKGSSTMPESFDCDGKLTVQGEKAVLEDLRFERSNAHERVRVCFERGARWRVTGFRQFASCDEADDLPPSRAESSSLHGKNSPLGASSSAGAVPSSAASGGIDTP